MKELFRRGFLLFLSLALLIWCTGCAPESAEGTGSLSSSPEEGKVLFQLDPEDIKYIQILHRDKGMHRISEREDIEKIVSIFNAYRYHDSLTLFQLDRYYPWLISFSGYIHIPPDKLTFLDCNFTDTGEVMIGGVPASGALTTYFSDQPNYFDEVFAYFYQQPSSLVSDPAE